MKDTKVKEDGKVDYIWYKNQYDRLLSEKCKYEHRIDKAIEYIEKVSPCMSDDEGGTLYMTSTIWGEDLLNILKGEEKR